MSFVLSVITADAQRRTIDYSKFSHSTHVNKQKLTCDSCHKFPTKNWKEVRKGDAAFPDVAEFPEHASCLNCHRQQFFARERPAPKICANCHVKGTPNDTTRHVFPSLGKAVNFISEFRVLFPQDKHADVEMGPLTHATCFMCHNRESELAPLPQNCDACHKTRNAAFNHAVAPQTADYSHFKHDDRNHARLPCLLCHRRENNSPRPTLPGKAAHAPCTGCHAQQFSNSASEICTICHTDVESGKVKAFPPLRSFDVKFDHAKHAGAACAACHRRNRNGVGLSIPSRLSAHVTCFSCHTPAAQNISSCSTCHQLGHFVRTPEQARAYRVGFSHANHDVACRACHEVGRQVSAPLPLNHHAPSNAFSCATCHNGRRAFGGDDFSACKRCHKGSTWGHGYN